MPQDSGQTRGQPFNNEYGSPRATSYELRSSHQQDGPSAPTSQLQPAHRTATPSAPATQQQPRNTSTSQILSASAPASHSGHSSSQKNPTTPPKESFVLHMIMILDIDRKESTLWPVHGVVWCWDVPSGPGCTALSTLYRVRFEHPWN